MSFKDLFSAQAARYAQYRPTYPRELFDWIAETAPRTDRLWDCATGNGQAAVALAEYFDRVDATDASHAQIASATPHDRVHYSVGTAEQPGLSADSYDAVTVATAYHWLDHDRFAETVRQLARDEALVVVWTYATATIPPAASALTGDFVPDILGPYWAPEVSAVMNGYADLPFDFQEIETPELEIRRRWHAEDYLNYMRTWSAAQSYVEANDADPFEDVARDFSDAWGKAPVDVTWELHIRAGRV